MKLKGYLSIKIEQIQILNVQKLSDKFNTKEKCLTRYKKRICLKLELNMILR